MKPRNVILTVVMVVGILFAESAQAQYGQNKVIYEDKEVLFYQSEHVDFYHWQDVKDKNQIKNLAHVVDQVERSYGYLSNYLSHSLGKRPNVVFYRTHSIFAATQIIGDHISEGVLAFALPTFTTPTRYVLAIKLDRPVEEYDATITHEMAHIFQFDMAPNIFERLIGKGPPHWIVEGGAEFLGNEYNGSRSDDLREDIRRGAGANPEKDLPTLNEEDIDPYTFGEMRLRFIKEKYGEEVIKKFLIRAFKDGENLVEVLAELTDGAVRSPEQFDEAQRDHWREKFGLGMLTKPRPYQENEHFRGRHVVPAMHRRYPVISQVMSPDGKKLAVITVNSKYGVVLAVIPALPRETPVYKPESKSDHSKEQKSDTEMWKINILTPFFPPKHFEYIALDLQVSNLSWTKAGDKEYIVFFAQKDKDHILFVIDPDNRKNLRSFLIPLDNSLSPSFSSDGKRVIFSASHNTVRDLYEIDLESGKISNLTNDDAYEEGPSVSPDGKTVAYISFWGDFRKIFLLNLNTGNKKQITFGRFNDLSPSWSDDGRLITYSSDETDGVSNLYTLELETNMVSQWTDFYGRKFTPRFARGENDRIYYVHLWQYSQYMSFIGQNFELFDILLKKPYRRYVMRDSSEQSSLVFIPDRDLFEFELDENQLLNPTPAPEKWGCTSGDIQFGASTYWGMFGESYFGCSNLFGTKQHLARFLLYGSFRIIDYSYLNREKRTSWRWGASHIQIPLRYQFYDIINKEPKQFILNQTWVKQNSFDLRLVYPKNKFESWELFSSLQHRSFITFGINRAALDAHREVFSPNDIQLFNFFEKSTGSNLGFGAAYNRNTVLGSYDTWGPFHGNALRVQVGFAPPMGEEFQGFTSASVSAKTYRYLGLGSLFAGRVDFMANSRANGDFMLLCGPEYGRGCEYGSMVGNQIGYISGELRFPIPGTYLLGMPVRGFLFGDAATAKFNDDEFPAQKLKIYGIGVQYIIPFLSWPAQSIWTRDNGEWRPSFYVTWPW